MNIYYFIISAILIKTGCVSSSPYEKIDFFLDKSLVNGTVLIDMSTISVIETHDTFGRISIIKYFYDTENRLLKHIYISSNSDDSILSSYKYKKDTIYISSKNAIDTIIQNNRNTYAIIGRDGIYEYKYQLNNDTLIIDDFTNGLRGLSHNYILNTNKQIIKAKHFNMGSKQLIADRDIVFDKNQLPMYISERRNNDLFLFSYKYSNNAYEIRYHMNSKIYKIDSVFYNSSIKFPNRVDSYDIKNGTPVLVQKNIYQYKDENR